MKDKNTHVRTTTRSKTYGVNVVQKADKHEATSHINIFIDGIPERSLVVDGVVDIASALIAVGTQLKLEDK